MAQQSEELMLQAGPAPLEYHANGASDFEPCDEMPEHTATPRKPKITDGELTGRPSRTPRKKSKRKANPQLDTEGDCLSTPSKRNKSTAIDALKCGLERFRRPVKQKAALQKLTPYVVGIDLGMWGFGSAISPQNGNPLAVKANQRWPKCNKTEMKSPTWVAFKSDNPENGSFRGNKDALVGFQVKPGMKRIAFFKTLLEYRAQATEFNNPILGAELAQSLIPASQQKAVESAHAVFKYLKGVIAEDLAKAFNNNKATIEQTPIFYVLTHPAACSKAGRDKLESIAKETLKLREFDEIRLLSECHAGCSSCVIDLKEQIGNRAWRVYVREDSLVTILDMGSFTNDATTEQVVGNEARITLKEVIVSAGGSCGTVTLHCELVKFVIEKYGITYADIADEIDGRDSVFFESCEVLFTDYAFEADVDDDEDGAHRLDLDINPTRAHDDYEDDTGRVVLRQHEIETIIDRFLVYSKAILKDQWTRALERTGQHVETLFVCGGGAMIDRVYQKLEEFCQGHEPPVSPFRPHAALSAVCRGAVISQLNANLLGQRVLTASYGIKFKGGDGRVTMRWLINIDSSIDTTKAKTIQQVQGHFLLSIHRLMEDKDPYRVPVITFEGPALTGKTISPEDPDDPRNIHITDIVLDKTHFSYAQRKNLTEKMEELAAQGRDDAMIDGEIRLIVDSSGRLFFEARHDGLLLGKGKLRDDASKTDPWSG